MLRDNPRENPYAACAVLAGDDGRSYQLAGYRGSGGCSIVEIDSHLGIFGDLSPLDNRGVWSSRGFSMDWFLGATEEVYVASKFLRAGWHPDIAERDLAELLDQVTSFPTRGANVPALKELIAARAWEGGEVPFLNACAAAGIHSDESEPGYGYNTHDVYLIAGLRQKIVAFREAPPPSEPSRPPPSPRIPRRSNLGEHMRPGLRRA